MKYITSLIIIFLISFNAFAIEFGFDSIVTTLAVADVRQTITAVETKTIDFVIQNPSTNVVPIFVGGSGVTTSGATKGLEIVPGTSLSFSASGRNNVLSSSKIFMITTGTGVPVTVSRVTF